MQFLYFFVVFPLSFLWFSPYHVSHKRKCWIWCWLSCVGFFFNIITYVFFFLTYCCQVQFVQKYLKQHTRNTLLLIFNFRFKTYIILFTDLFCQWCAKQCVLRFSLKNLNKKQNSLSRIYTLQLCAIFRFSFIFYWKLSTIYCVLTTYLGWIYSWYVWILFIIIKFFKKY